MLNFQNLNI